MEQVIRIYGKFLLEAAVVAALILLLFAGITDGQGNRGILHMAGAVLKEEESLSERIDMACYRDECVRSAPVITYTVEGMLCIGEYPIDGLFAARDDRGTVLSLRVRSICSPHGGKQEYTSELEQIRFDERGIYTVCVSATDAWNRTCVCEFRIPVNSQEGMY